MRFNFFIYTMYLAKSTNFKILWDNTQAIPCYFNIFFIKEAQEVDKESRQLFATAA